MSTVSPQYCRLISCPYVMPVLRVSGSPCAQFWPRTSTLRLLLPSDPKTPARFSVLCVFVTPVFEENSVLVT